MMQVTMVRHGSTAANLEKRYLGITDMHLSKRGEGEARAVQDRLAGQSFDRIVSSPLERCRQTAEGFALTTDPRLSEIDFGTWENLTFPEVLERHPDEVQRWAEDEASFSFPGGEAVAAFQERVLSFAAELESGSWQQVLLFTHGGVIRTLLCHWLGLDLNQHMRFDIQPASLATVEWNTGIGRLLALENVHG